MSTSYTEKPLVIPKTRQFDTSLKILDMIPCQAWLLNKMVTLNHRGAPKKHNIWNFRIILPKISGLKKEMQVRFY